MKKQERGITLVALIITIVVLLILAVVAINSIQDGGILGYANDAATKYNQAQVNEQATLGAYVDWIKYKTCSHTYVNGECTNCGYSPCSEGHTYEWIVTKEANCKTKTDGDCKQVCAACGNTGEVRIGGIAYVHQPDDTQTCTVCEIWEGDADDCGELITVYVARDNMTHDIYEWWVHWQQGGTTEEYFCTNIGCGSQIDMDGSSDGTCPGCGNVCDHNYGTYIELYDNETHKIQCDACYKVLNEESHDLKSTDENYDNLHKCSKCDYEGNCVQTEIGDWTADGNVHEQYYYCGLCKTWQWYNDHNIEYSRPDECTICNPPNN